MQLCARLKGERHTHTRECSQPFSQEPICPKIDAPVPLLARERSADTDARHITLAARGRSVPRRGDERPRSYATPSRLPDFTCRRNSTAEVGVVFGSP